MCELTKTRNRVTINNKIKGCETMAWEDVVSNISRHIIGDVCPQCKRAWVPGHKCPYCGYSPKIVACPRCADIRTPSIADKKKAHV